MDGSYCCQNFDAANSTVAPRKKGRAACFRWQFGMRRYLSVWFCEAIRHDVHMNKYYRNVHRSIYPATYYLTLLFGEYRRMDIGEKNDEKSCPNFFFSASWQGRTFLEFESIGFPKIMGIPEGRTCLIPASLGHFRIAASKTPREILRIFWPTRYTSNRHKVVVFCGSQSGSELVGSLYSNVFERVSEITTREIFLPKIGKSCRCFSIVAKNKTQKK